MLLNKEHKESAPRDGVGDLTNVMMLIPFPQGSRVPGFYVTRFTRSITFTPHNTSWSKFHDHHYFIFKKTNILRR